MQKYAMTQINNWNNRSNESNNFFFFFHYLNIPNMYFTDILQTTACIPCALELKETKRKNKNAVTAIADILLLPLAGQSEYDHIEHSTTELEKKRAKTIGKTNAYLQLIQTVDSQEEENHKLSPVTTFLFR